MKGFSILEWLKSHAVLWAYSALCAWRVFSHWDE